MCIRTVSWLPTVFVSLVFTSLAMAYVIPDFDSAFFLKNSDLVCKIQVKAIRQDGMVNASIRGMETGKVIPRSIATCQVLSVIKGESDESIDIENTHTPLAKGRVLIVFLERQEPHYVFSYHNGILPALANDVPYDMGEKPIQKLLTECLALAGSENIGYQRQAVEEIGKIADEMIRSARTFSREQRRGMQNYFREIRRALAKARGSEDPRVKRVAYISSFQANDDPGIEGPLSLLNATPKRQVSSVKREVDSGYSVPALQRRLVTTIDSTTRRAIFDMTDGQVLHRELGEDIFRGIQKFDYATFLREALKCSAVARDVDMRKAIANVIWIRYEQKSIPEMVKLLDDTDTQVRRTAVAALRKAVLGRNGAIHSEQSEDFWKQEEEHIRYWKSWWSKQQETFVPRKRGAY